MVMDGMGWNPSSLAGRAGEDVQKYTCTDIILSKDTCTNRFSATALYSEAAL
jgi:hypothetical protein